jgi:hypothetical protein
MTAQPRAVTPDKLPRLVARLAAAGFHVSRARITPDGEIVLDFATPGAQPVDPHGTQPIDLVSWERPRR